MSQPAVKFQGVLEPGFSPGDPVLPSAKGLLIVGPVKGQESLRGTEYPKVTLGSLTDAGNTPSIGPYYLSKGVVEGWVTISVAFLVVGRWIQVVNMFAIAVMGFVRD